MAVDDVAEVGCVVVDDDDVVDDVRVAVAVDVAAVAIAIGAAGVSVGNVIFLSAASPEPPSVIHRQHHPLKQPDAAVVTVNTYVNSIKHSENHHPCY